MAFVPTLVIILGFLIAACDGQSAPVASNIYDSLQPLGCSQVSDFRSCRVCACVQEEKCPAGLTYRLFTFYYGFRRAVFHLFGLRRWWFSHFLISGWQKGESKKMI